MSMMPRLAAILLLALFTLFAPVNSMAGSPREASAEQSLIAWYGLVLQLIRHTPTYSPPVASRSLAYLGVTAFESVASGSDDLQSLAGQLDGLRPLPRRNAGQVYDEGVVLNAALASLVQELFQNTGPTGQRVIGLQDTKQRRLVSEGVPADVIARSEDYG